jgi:hypothetical protein
MTPPRAGFLLPRDAVLYDENGAYVYKRLPKKERMPTNGSTRPSRYRCCNPPAGAGWSRVSTTMTMIVVRGAGVLWSMQDAGAHAVDDDD